MIEIINLTKRYGNITAVADISLTSPNGQLFGFLGPNGAGKTTFAREFLPREAGCPDVKTNFRRREN